MKKLLASFLLISSMANAGWSGWIPSWNTVRNAASSAWQSVAQSSVYNSASTFVSNHPTATTLVGTAAGLGVAMAVIKRGHNDSVKRTVVRVNEAPNYNTPETHQRWFDKAPKKKSVESKIQWTDLVTRVKQLDSLTAQQLEQFINDCETAQNQDTATQILVNGLFKQYNLTFELLNQKLEAKKAATVSSSTSVVATPAKPPLSKKAKALIVLTGGAVATGIGYGLYCYLNNGEQPSTVEAATEEAAIEIAAATEEAATEIATEVTKEAMTAEENDDFNNPSAGC